MSASSARLRPAWNERAGYPQEKGEGSRSRPPGGSGGGAGPGGSRRGKRTRPPTECAPLGLLFCCWPRSLPSPLGHPGDYTTTRLSLCPRKGGFQTMSSLRTRTRTPLFMLPCEAASTAPFFSWWGLLEEIGRLDQAASSGEGKRERAEGRIRHGWRRSPVVGQVRFCSPSG